MANFNNVPLHKRTHFRRLRELSESIMKYEGLDISQYNLFNIRCYEAYGRDLKGRNVFFNTSGSESFIVSGSKKNPAIYEVYEIPHIGNTKGSPIGKFFFLMYFKDWKYWLVGELIVKSSRV